MVAKNAAATLKAEVPEGAVAGREQLDVKQILTDAKPRLVALLQSEIWVRENGVKLNTWEAVVPAGTPFESVLEHAFWANVSRRMKMGDKIIVLPRDGAWYAELLVWDAGQNWAHVAGAMVERPEFKTVAGVDEQFEIVTDPVDGVIIRRKDTRAVIKRNLPNHEDARRWLLEHQQALRS